MLFNGDLVDVISEVRFAKIVNSKIANSKLFTYLHKYRENEAVYEDFMIETSASIGIIELAQKDTDVLEWILEVTYYYYEYEKVPDMYDNYIFALACVVDDRPKIEVLAEKRAGHNYSSLLTYGTLDQIKWLYSINPHIFEHPIQIAIEDVCELEVMKFIFSINGIRYYSKEWTSIICHNPVKKREFATLELIMSHIRPSRNLRYYTDHEYKKLFVLIQNIARNGDDSFLQWLMINHPAGFKESIEYNAHYNENFIITIMSKCTLPTLKMYIKLMDEKIMSSAYNNFNINIGYVNSIAL